MKRIVIFGGGNIGRSFIGQLFARSGYEVVFVDIAKDLVSALNSRNEYKVIIKESRKPDESIDVKNVRAVDGTDTNAVVEEILHADILATAVGMAAVPYILPVIAAGIGKRISQGLGGIDIIIAENIRSAATWYREELFPTVLDAAGSGMITDRLVGLVETSIGKMVPIMTEADRKADPLQIFAEAYNTLIVDAKGFRNGIPDLAWLKPVDNILAYVDRKLFIHNLGHAAAAYIGYARNPEAEYIYEHIADPGTQDAVRACMRESAAALAAEYPEAFNSNDLNLHIDDLLRRFGNAALRDTVYRVGRDTTRKLGRDDRLIGAMLLAAKHGMPYDSMAAAAGAAIGFKATDEAGEMYPGDADFQEKLSVHGVDWILENVCGLLPDNAVDSRIIHAIKANFAD